MNKAFLYFFSILLLLGSNKSFAQVSALRIKKDFFKGSTAVTSVRLNTSEVAFVSNDSDRSVEIICTDNDFKQKWSAKVEGYYQNAARLGDNLLILVSTDFTLFTRANSTFKAYLLNYKNGDILKEKLLFEGNNEFLTVPYFMASKDHKSYSFAVRETALKRNVKIAPGALGAIYLNIKLNNQFNKQKTFNVLTFNESLEQIEIVSPDLPAGQFIGIQRTINNDLYTAVSENKKGVTISRYLPGKDAPVKSVTEPYSFKGGLIGVDFLNEHIKLIADTLNNHTVYITGAFKNGEDFIMLFNKYDFEKDQHKSFQKRYTKDEVKGIEKSYTAVNKKFKKLSLAPPKALELVDVIINDSGYFLVVSDFQYKPYDMMTKSQPQEYSEGIIVYNLDKSMSVKTISTIPRYYSGVVRADMKSYQKDNTLYIMAPHYGDAQFLLGKINMINGKVEEIMLVSPDKSGSNDYPCLSTSMVSDNSIILPVLDYKAFVIGKIKFDVNMYRFGW